MTIKEYRRSKETTTPPLQEPNLPTPSVVLCCCMNCQAELSKINQLIADMHEQIKMFDNDINEDDTNINKLNTNIERKENEVAAKKVGIDGSNKNDERRSLQSHCSQVIHQSTFPT